MNREEAMVLVKQATDLYATGEYGKAVPLLQQCADAGFIPFFTLLGDCYWNGDGVEKDTVKAIQYYLYAAEMGDADGLMRMGNVYARSNDPAKAIDSFFKAFEKGKSDGLLNIGKLFYGGLGELERNFKIAADYMEKYISIVPDDDEALHLLGRCYLFMKESDLRKAEILLAKSAALGNKQARRDLDALQLGGNIIEY